MKETVRLAGISTGFGEVQLEDEQIAQFEALGISSEWHSSALSMAVMVLAKHKGGVRDNGNSRPVALDLDDLFEALAARPVGGTVIDHGVVHLYRAARTPQPEPVAPFDAETKERIELLYEKMDAPLDE